MSLRGVMEMLSVLGVELAYAIISTYATVAVVRLVLAALTHRPTSHIRILEGVGGAMYLVGIILWRDSDYAGGYNQFLLLKSVGLATMIFPRIASLATGGGNGSHH